MKILNYEITKAGTIKGLQSDSDKLKRIESQLVRKMIGRKMGQVSYHNTQAATPFLGQYYPGTTNLSLYRIIREIVSFLDVAVLKLGLYVGDFEVYSDNERSQDALRDFKDNVKVNYFSRGLKEFLKQMIESTLALGMGIGERVDNGSLFGETRLFNGNAEFLRFIPDKQEGIVLGYQPTGVFQPKPFENPDNVYFLAFDQRDGNPWGYSIFNSLNFVARIYTRLNEALHNQAWRIGDPIYFTMVMGDSDDAEQELAEDISNNIKDQFESVSALKAQGEVGDMHIWGPSGFDIKIKMLGADGETQLMDFEFPSRMVIEQMTAKLLLPPWDYGLYNWNSNYKMSDAQQDALKSVLWGYREKINPHIEDIINKESVKAGFVGTPWRHVWNDIDFTDRADRAKAAHLEASTQEKLVGNQLTIWGMGIIDDEQLYDNLTNIGVVDIEASNKQKAIENLHIYRKLLLLQPAGDVALGKTRFELVRAIMNDEE